MKHWRQSRGEVFVYLLQLIVVIVLLIKVLSWGGSQRLISLGVCLLDAACRTPSAALLLWMHVRRTRRSGSSNSNGLLTKSLLHLGEQVMYQFLGKLFICVATWTKSKLGRWTGLLAAFRKCEFEVVTGHEMGSLALAFGRDGWSCTGWILLQCCHECLRKVHQVHSVMSGYVFCLNLWVSGKMHVARWDLAICIFEMMSLHQALPGVITFNAALGSCKGGGQWERAFLMWQEMQVACSTDSKDSLSREFF